MCVQYKTFPFFVSKQQAQKDTECGGIATNPAVVGHTRTSSSMMVCLLTQITRHSEYYSEAGGDDLDRAEAVDWFEWLQIGGVRNSQHPLLNCDCSCRLTIGRSSVIRVRKQTKARRQRMESAT